MKENSNATDANVATIEEDIKTMENIIKSYIEADECGLSNNDFKCEIQALSNILSDYKRVLKENEELNKSKITLERENNIQEKTKKIVEEKYIYKDKIKKILNETEITDFNSLIEAFLKIKKLLESE